MWVGCSLLSLRAGYKSSTLANEIEIVFIINSFAQLASCSEGNDRREKLGEG